MLGWGWDPRLWGRSRARRGGCGAGDRGRDENATVAPIAISAPSRVLILPFGEHLPLDRCQPDPL